MLKEWEDVILMLVNMIWKLKNMYLYLKVMFIRRNKLFKMLLFMIWIWLMLDHKVVTIS